jgi:hypothetical protein
MLNVVMLNVVAPNLLHTVKNIFGVNFAFNIKFSKQGKKPEPAIEWSA